LHGLAPGYQALGEITALFHRTVSIIKILTADFKNVLNISQSGWRVGKSWQLVGCRNWLIFRCAFSFSIHCCTWELLFVLSTAYLPSSQPTTEKKNELTGNEELQGLSCDSYCQ